MVSCCLCVCVNALLLGFNCGVVCDVGWLVIRFVVMCFVRWCVRSFKGVLGVLLVMQCVMLYGLFRVLCVCWCVIV